MKVAPQAIVAVVLLAAPARAAITSLDEVRYWIGSGTNRAAVVIDWNGDAPEGPALAWGFRWDGAATGEKMLRAVIAADDRLFAKLGVDGPFGLAVRGLGYDGSDDGQFALDDGITTFDADGVAESGPADGAASIDPADPYREGWFTGVWNYGIANVNPWASGGWNYSMFGASARTLVDGGWDSWAFTPTFRQSAFAASALAATQPADFNSDGVVDGADVLAWQRGLGASTGGATRPAGDATIDGVIDGADLAAWLEQFAGNAAGAAVDAVALAGPSASAIPEPNSIGICASAMFVLCRKATQPRTTRRSAS